MNKFWSKVAKSTTFVHSLLYRFFFSKFKSFPNIQGEAKKTTTSPIALWHWLIWHPCFYMITLGILFDEVSTSNYLQIAIIFGLQTL